MTISINACSVNEFLSSLPHSAVESIPKASGSFILSDIQGIPGKYDRQVIFAVQDSRIVGFLHFYYMPDMQLCHIAGIFVDDDYRRLGIASRLMEELTNHCEVNKWRKVMLSMNPPTEEKAGLWRSMRRIAARHPYRIQLVKQGPKLHS